MWSVLFLVLSYLAGDLVRGKLAGLSPDAESESEVVFRALGDSLCARSSSVWGYRLHRVSDSEVEVRSVRAPGGQLLQCAMSSDRAQVSSFMSACRLGLREQDREQAHEQEHFTTVDEAKRDCERLHAREAAGVSEHAQRHRRAKRGFTYPGTLWCGAGNIADHYDQLGEFSETDKCCRTHDHCPHVIHAFSSYYGYTNFKWHSISHCDCDNTLKQCLRSVNDTSSRVVGQAFFNVIEVPCFEFSFQEQCVERHWYGVCKRYDRVPVAVIRESIPYDFGGIEVIDVLTLAPPKKKLSDLDRDNQDKTTQASFSGSKSTTPEEPSLTNVVTAAEDFIKVLATVSSSQTSSADSGKGETQTSDKKRKKNGGKKKKDKKRRGKGKGKKRKQNTGRVIKADEGIAGAPSANRTEEVINKNHFVEDPGHFKRINKNDNFMTGAFDTLVDGGHSNKMMRDEFQRVPDANQVSPPTATITEPNAKQRDEMQKPQKQIKDLESASAVHIPTAGSSKPRRARLRQRVERKRHRHLTPTSLPLEATIHNRMEDNPLVSATESTSLAGQTTLSPSSPAGEEVPRNLEYWPEKGDAFIAATQNTSIVGTKRPRLRVRGGRKRSRKLCPSSSPIDKEGPKAAAEDPLVHSTDATQDLTVDLCPQPLGILERLQPKLQEKLTESLASSPTSSEGLPKRHQRLKGTRDKRRHLMPSSNQSARVDTRQKVKITTVTSRTVQALTSVDSQVLLHTKNSEASTVQLFPAILPTSTPSTLPLTAKTANKRGTRKRGDKKRRKSKGTEK
ncbi:uncharacterized protein proca1 [Hoplias malabaricus]|uniref:uncharacterized protein proca1 n=1 Tax=Hoplias malabaricus TaxID=27720 RepID=UPI00346312B1